MTPALCTVFGATGYLGSAVVTRLLAGGWRVRVAARRPGLPDADAVECVACDVRRAPSVADALEGARAAVNVVSLYVEGGGASFQAVHVDGARNVARTARDCGLAALAHISGIGADPRSRSRYVAARGRGEAAVREAMPEATVLRPSVLFGPGDAFLGTIDRLTRLPLVPLFGRGETRLQPVHVDDVAAAVTRAIEAPEPPARTFELGGPEVLAYRRVLELVLARNGRRRPLVPVPFAAWHALAMICRALPRPPLTRDQVVLMQRDNVVGPGMPGLAELGIEPRSLSSHLAVRPTARG